MRPSPATFFGESQGGECNDSPSNLIRQYENLAEFNKRSLWIRRRQMYGKSVRVYVTSAVQSGTVSANVCVNCVSLCVRCNQLSDDCVTKGFKSMSGCDSVQGGKANESQEETSNFSMSPSCLAVRSWLGPFHCSSFGAGRRRRGRRQETLLIIAAGPVRYFSSLPAAS